MRYFITFLICVALVSVSSCRKDFSTIPNFGSAEFSKDTSGGDTMGSNSWAVT